MFSKHQKKEIAKVLIEALRKTNHPELPMGPIEFTLLVMGRHNSSSIVVGKDAEFGEAVQK